jgi:hypothetical protein
MSSQIPYSKLAQHHRPKGFPRYRDKSSSLSATVNKFLHVNGLRPTKDHSVYSMYHSFKDRLVAAEVPDSLIDSLTTPNKRPFAAIEAQALGRDRLAGAGALVGQEKPLCARLSVFPLSQFRKLRLVFADGQFHGQEEQ